MRKKRFKSLLILLVSASLLISNSLSAVATSTADSNSENSSEMSEEEKNAAREKAEQALEEAKKEKEQLEGALANAEALVKNLKESQSSTQSKIKSLNGELSSLSAKISELETQLGDLESDIDEAKENLAAAEEDAAKQYDAMKLRIQYIYENGNTNYLTMILSSKSIAALLNALEYVSMLSEYDRNMLDEYQACIEYQEQLKAELEAEYETVKTMQEQIGVQKQTVQVLKDAKSEELAAIGEDLEDAEAIAEAYEQEVKAQNEILTAIQQQIVAMDYGEKFLTGGAFGWPCPNYKYVSSDYGPRTAPTSGASTVHKGIDLAAPYGSAILAAESGKVTTAAYSSSAGNYVIVNHGMDDNGNVICTVYMHCSSLAVSAGDYVYRGQTIAAVGSTGVSTGNHLHFGVTVNGSYVSPWGYVAKP